MIFQRKYPMKPISMRSFTQPILFILLQINPFLCRERSSKQTGKDLKKKSKSKWHCQQIN